MYIVDLINMSIGTLSLFIITMVFHVGNNYSTIQDDTANVLKYHYWSARAWMWADNHKQNKYVETCILKRPSSSLIY
jgi:hypothetical protein